MTATVSYDIDQNAWKVVAPGVGILMQNGGSGGSFPDYATSWTQYAESDANMVHPVELFDLVQVQCLRNFL